MIDKLFIDGAWVAPIKGGAYPVIDPATEETFHHIPVATAEDVDLAVAAARRAFDSGPWPRMTASERASVLRKIADGIRARLDELSRLEVRDNGKPYPEAKWDIEDAAGCFDFYADVAEEYARHPEEAVDVGNDQFSSKAIREPTGVVGAITPWNFPLLMSCWKVAPALAAGCTVVLKPSETASLTSLELGAIALEAGLPNGALNILTGPGPQAGQPIVDHPAVDKLAFTGSVSVGSKIGAAAARDIKAVSLELGGKSPFIIFEDADIEKAVEWIMFGIFWNKGEVCSATSRVLVQESLYPRLMDRLVEETRKISIGSGMEEGVLLGPVISKPQYDKILGAIETARKDGAKVATGGARAEGFSKGYYIAPTILEDVPLDSKAWTEEIFGPVVCLKSFTDEAEAVRLANDSSYGLAGAVMSADDARCERVARALKAGIIWVNCSQPTFTQAPWGGYKKSGIGRELGRWGFENYLETKQITRFDSDQPWGWFIKSEEIGR